MHQFEVFVHVALPGAAVGAQWTLVGFLVGVDGQMLAHLEARGKHPGAAPPWALVAGRHVGLW